MKKEREKKESKGIRKERKGRREEGEGERRMEYRVLVT